MVVGVTIQTGQSVAKRVAEEQEKGHVPAPTLPLHTMESLAREKAKRQKLVTVIHVEVGKTN
jgi:hypothetical protein